MARSSPTGACATARRRSQSEIPVRPGLTGSSRRCPVASGSKRLLSSMTITNVGVIGCGLMGSGIVQVSAQAGFEVLFVEANDELVKRGFGRLRETLEGLASRGKLDAKVKDAALARIAGTTRLDDLKVGRASCR